MSLTKKQKCDIQKVHLHYTNVPISELPQFSEILESMYEQIKKTGITKIKKCPPSEANCIIRVYQIIKDEPNSELFSNIYGAVCYTKSKNIWETSDGIKNYPLEYNKYYQLRIPLLPDETLIVNASYIDDYVKIK